MKTTAYKVATHGCEITIVMAKHILHARKWAREEYGRRNHPVVTRATEGDIDWVKGMSGMIHVAE